MRENRYELRYVSKRDGKEKKCYPIGAAAKDEQLNRCRERGIRVLSCRKMYPINMEKHAHDFELICNICRNAISDMEDGTTPWDGKEYDRLQHRAERAEYFYLSFGMFNSPISWFTGEEYAEAKEMYVSAQMHREDACRKAGIPYVE